MAVLLLSAASAGAGSVPAAPASAQTITFGASLTEAPDPEFDCAALPLPGGFATPPSSCVLSTPLNPSDPTQGLITPVGTGTITGVRIRVGASTGPMSLVVLQSEKNIATQTVSCCEAVLVTQPFMPTPNTVNAFRANLPVHTDDPGLPTADGLQLTDMLALAVLNGATPIPAVNEGGSGAAPVDELGSPAPLEGQSASMVAASGYQLDLQADWVPGTPAPTTPVVRFASGRVFVSHGYLHVPLRCHFDVCKGTIVVKSVARATPRLTYASGRFQIGQNLYRSIAVPLTAAGIGAARTHRRIAVAIELSYRTPSSSKLITRSVTLMF
jgi:hypothetical protein